MYRILLIEDDARRGHAAAEALRARGHEVVAVDAAEAMTRIDASAFDVVIAKHAEGTRPGAALHGQHVPHEVVYLDTPFTSEELLEAVRRITHRDTLRAELAAARRERRAPPLMAAGPIVGTSPALQCVLESLAAVADSDAPVLLEGESGTGKELLARTIHARSARRDRPLVAVNCTAFPETLLEAELFGYERGAFTGAAQRRAGRFVAADGGTLFLDEVNGLSPAAQAKLLRVLQDGTFQPIGTNTTVAVDIRLVSATNRSLKAMVAEGTFREDLYYRINVLDIEMPPLRARRGDLPLLVEYFLAKHTPPGRAPPLVSPRAWAALRQHPFPGNVRELEHAIQHALVVSRGGEIDAEHLPRDLRPPDRAGSAGGPTTLRPLVEAVREFERDYLLQALRITGGSRTRTAALLGISRKNLWAKLRMHLPGTEGAHEDEDD